MQRILIGIGTTRPDHAPCVVCGCAAYPQEAPYSKKLDAYLDHVLCWTATTGDDPVDAINAVTWRLVEKLYLAHRIPEPELSHVQVLVKPRYRHHELEPVKEVVRSHWLISTSNMLLNEL